MIKTDRLIIRNSQLREESFACSNPVAQREFDPDEMLSKIMQLFREHGYEATALSDIIPVTGMGRASLYSAFGNKQEM